MLFSLLRELTFSLLHHLDLNISDTALKVSRSLYCFTTSISHVVENYFPRLWGMDISGAILHNCHISIYSYSPVNKFYSFIIFSLLNCLVLMLNLYMQFLSLRCYFLYLNII